MPGFTMRVEDVFRLGDGRTVFVGGVDGERTFIGPCVCRLFVDETMIAEYQIEGEMLVERREGSQPWRSLSTTAEVELDRAQVLSGRVRLVRLE